MTLEEIVAERKRLNQLFEDTSDGFAYVVGENAYGSHYKRIVKNGYHAAEIAARYNGDNGNAMIYTNNPDFTHEAYNVSDDNSIVIDEDPLKRLTSTKRGPGKQR